MTDVDFRFTIGPTTKDVYQKTTYLNPSIPKHPDENIRNGAFNPEYPWERCIIRYFLNSEDDLRRAEEDSGFDLSYARHRLAHDVRLRYSKASVTVLDFDKNKILDNLHLRYKGSKVLEYYLHNEAVNEDAYPVVILKNIEFFQAVQSLGKFKGYISKEISPEYQAFSYNHKELDKKDRKYRLYLNERLLVERVWDTEVDCNRFCYEETISLNNIPKDGYNFKLVTSLNLGFVTALVNGMRHPVTGKSFSLES